MTWSEVGVVQTPTYAYLLCMVRWYVYSARWFVSQRIAWICVIEEMHCTCSMFLNHTVLESVARLARFDRMRHFSHITKPLNENRHFGVSMRKTHLWLWKIPSTGEGYLFWFIKTLGLPGKFQFPCIVFLSGAVAMKQLKFIFWPRLPNFNEWSR